MFFLPMVIARVMILDTISIFILWMSNEILMMTMFVFPRDCLRFTDRWTMKVLERMRVTIGSDSDDEEQRCHEEKSRDLSKLMIQ